MLTKEHKIKREDDMDNRLLKEPISGSELKTSIVLHRCNRAAYFSNVGRAPLQFSEGRKNWRLNCNLNINIPVLKGLD